jgi:hypothetical protein
MPGDIEEIFTIRLLVYPVNAELRSSPGRMRAMTPNNDARYRSHPSTWFQLAKMRLPTYRTGLRGSLESLDLDHPARQWVPSGENLGHQPPLMIAGGGCPP